MFMYEYVFKNKPQMLFFTAKSLATQFMVNTIHDLRGLEYVSLNLSWK